MSEELCPCTAMPTPHRHVTATLPGPAEPLPVLDFRPITRPYPVEFCWSCPKRTKRATMLVYRDGVYVKSLCDRHADSEQALAERMAQ